MKLATLKDGSRDGQLVVVSRDLATAHYATGIAHRLQQVLDDWGFMAPQLQDLYDTLNAGRARHPFPFDAQHCMAPLARAFQCLQGVPEQSPRAEPTLHQVSGDALLGVGDRLVLADTALGLDLGAGVAVIVGDLAAGSTAAQALDGVRLVTLANTWVLRGAQRWERAAGQTPLRSRPATSLGPVAVTLDELGTDWQDGRVALTLHVSLNGRKLGLCDAAAGMPHSFGDLLAQACATRPLRAGSVLCSGPLLSDGPRGHASLASKHRANATATPNAGAQTEPEVDGGGLQAGDSVQLELKARDGSSPLGRMLQEVMLTGVP